MNPYKEKWQNDRYKQGIHFQDFVIEELYKIGLPIISYSSKEYQIMIGENKAGIEIKNDNLYQTYGNLFIEIAEKSHASNKDYVPSGIYRNDNTWLYLIGDEKKIFIFGKKHLISCHQSEKYREKTIETSKGFLLPVINAEKIAVKIIIPASTPSQP